MTRTNQSTELPKTRRDYKDTMFRMLFNGKEELLSLYNAVRGSSYTDADELEIVTLENAVYLNMKNDVAFVIDCSLNLYEHQSTYNPNMPLRNLFYVTKELSMLVEHKKLYLRRLVKIPAPRFIVFYNGKEEQPERKYLRLSDSFECLEEEPELELVVTVLNINLGKNKELLGRCRSLKEYMVFVTKVRENTEQMPLSEAVERAVQECIDSGILREFLLKNRKEVVEMCIFEYDEESVIRAIREDEFDLGKKEGMDLGKREGMEQGRIQGEERAFLLNQKLLADNRMEDLKRVIEDAEYRWELYAEYCI